MKVRVEGILTHTRKGTELFSSSTPVFFGRDELRVSPLFMRHRIACLLVIIPKAATEKQYKEYVVKTASFQAGEMAPVTRCSL